MYYVYKFVDKDGICIYVGKTKSLKSRISNHKNAEWYKSDLDIYYLEFEYKDTMDFIEKYCINKFKPVENFQNRNIIELENLNIEPLNFVKFNLETFLSSKSELKYRIGFKAFDYLNDCKYIKSFLDYDNQKYVLIFEYNEDIKKTCVIGSIVQVWILEEFEFDLSSSRLIKFSKDEDYPVLEVEIDLKLLKELVELKDIVYLNGIKELFRYLDDLFQNINNSLDFKKILNISECI